MACSQQCRVTSIFSNVCHWPLCDSVHRVFVLRVEKYPSRDPMFVQETASSTMPALCFAPRNYVIHSNRSIVVLHHSKLSVAIFGAASILGLRDNHETAQQSQMACSQQSRLANFFSSVCHETFCDLAHRMLAFRAACILQRMHTVPKRYRY